MSGQSVGFLETSGPRRDPGGPGYCLRSSFTVGGDFRRRGTDVLLIGVNLPPVEVLRLRFLVR